MGMSAEDFGAVLGEMPSTFTWADELERLDSQAIGRRWWFSIKTHATSHFEACEYHDYIQRGKSEAPLFSAQTVWNQLQRPELVFWIACVLGLVTDKRGQQILNELLLIDDADGRVRISKRTARLRELFIWENVEAAARKKHAQLVANSPLGHRGI